MLALGTSAPWFCLPDTEGNLVSLDRFKGAPVLLVMFICNHCPYVKHIQHALAQLAMDYQSRGVGVVAINSNDAETHPDDSPEKMAEEAGKAGYAFPYLHDDTQEVAKEFRAMCTPDFFVFDRDRKLVYRGQFDGSRPGNGVSINGEDLRRALDDTMAGLSVESDQKPSVGCNIKSKPGNEPGYSRQAVKPGVS